MNKNKFNFQNLKTNLRLEKLFQYYNNEITMTLDSIKKYSHPNFYSFRSILKAGYPLELDTLRKKDNDIPEHLKHLDKETAILVNQNEEVWDYIHETDKLFFESITEKEHANILNDIKNGDLLPNLNENFKKELLIFNGSKESYALISSKLNKKFYLFRCSLHLSSNRKNYEDLGSSKEYYYLWKILSKKIDKDELSQMIKDRDYIIEK